jgi:hypothetical protein
MDQASSAPEILHGSFLEYVLVERNARGSFFAFLLHTTVHYDFAYESGRITAAG